MSPERMRVRIAEYLGRHLFVSDHGYCGKCGKIFAEECHRVPDYPNDLNACHEMEMTLSDEQQSDYAEQLAANFSEEFCDLAGTAEHIFACAHLTSHQRAEAFCRTVGIWEEETTNPTP